MIEVTHEVRNVYGAIFIVIYLSSLLHCQVGNSLGLFAQIPNFVCSKSAIVENAKILKNCTLEGLNFY